MQVTVLGTRGEIKPSTAFHSRHSGILIDRTLLFDLGEKEFLAVQPSSILITHLHPDHAFFIRERQPVNIDIPIYAPETSKKIKDIKVVDSPFNLLSYRVIPIPTIHSKLVKSTAYLLQTEKYNLLYTGDLIWINSEFHPLLADTDLVITEGSYLRKGGMVRKDNETGQVFGHAGIPDLVQLFKRFTSNILLVHFGNWFFHGAGEARRRLGELGRTSGVNIFTGYDGLELELSELKKTK